MAKYTFADAVADRDEAYRLLHAAQARLDSIEARFNRIKHRQTLKRGRLLTLDINDVIAIVAQP